MERQVDKNEKLAQVKDMSAGALGGMLSKIFEYPLDTIKVLAQVSQLSHESSKFNPIATFYDAFREGGISRLYRGVSVPILGAAGECFVSFWFFGFAERKMKLYYKTNQLTITQIGFCGAFAGVGCGTWLAPVEFLKCQMQVSSSAARYNNSTWQCLKYNVFHKPQNLFTGLTTTWMREIPGSFMYFYVYRGTTRYLQQKYGKNKQNSINTNTNTSNTNNNDDPALWMVFTGGGMAGLVFWTLVYPIDLIKSKQQSSDMFAHTSSDHSINNNSNNTNSARMIQATRNSSNVFSLLKERFHLYGFRSLYYGYSVAAVRAVIANSLIFVGYEYSRKLLDNLVVDEYIDLDNTNNSKE